jgi:hypothetical protein
VPHANDLLFYRKLDDHLRIERVLHGVREVDNLMRE